MTGESLATGQAFVELANESLALFAVRWLNNYELVPTKGLIADFSMEDQRALFKRKEKIERWRKIASDNKKEKEEQERETKAKNERYSKPVELGKRPSSEQRSDSTKSQKPEKKQRKNISVINDVQELKSLLTANKSRGQRQRIQKRIAKLEVRSATSEISLLIIQNARTRNENTVSRRACYSKPPSLCSQ